MVKSARDGNQKREAFIIAGDPTAVPAGAMVLAWAFMCARRTPCCRNATEDHCITGNKQNAEYFPVLFTQTSCLAWEANGLKVLHLLVIILIDFKATPVTTL